MRLEHQHARQASHPVDVSEALRCPLDLVCHRSALQSSFVCHSPNSARFPCSACGPRSRLRSALCCVARLWRPRLCGYADGLRDFFLVMLLFAARGVPESLAARFGAGSGFLLGVAVFLVYLIYALGTNTFAFTRAAAIAVLFSSLLRSQLRQHGNHPAAGKTS